MLYAAEKEGGAPPSQTLITGFQETLSQCNLCDLPLIGYGFTWQRGNQGNHIRERIDQCIKNDAWAHQFPFGRLENLYTRVFDHTLILL